MERHRHFQTKAGTEAGRGARSALATLGSKPRWGTKLALGHCHASLARTPAAQVEEHHPRPAWATGSRGWQALAKEPVSLAMYRLSYSPVYMHKRWTPSPVR